MHTFLIRQTCVKHKRADTRVQSSSVQRAMLRLELAGTMTSPSCMCLQTAGLAKRHRSGGALQSVEGGEEEGGGGWLRGRSLLSHSLHSQGMVTICPAFLLSSAVLHMEALSRGCKGFDMTAAAAAAAAE